MECNIGILSQGYTFYGCQVTQVTHVKPVEHVTVLCTKFLNIFSFQKLIFSMLCVFSFNKNYVINNMCVCLFTTTVKLEINKKYCYISLGIFPQDGV